MTQLRRHWPIACAIGFFATLLLCIGPWSDLPLNDDWQYAHIAKSFAETGRFNIDVPVAPSVVGQSLIAWPVIRIFGFSHLALRLLTLLVTCLMLIEVEYLLCIAGVAAGVRFVALATLIANPIFLHLSTTFMTENYGYFVAFLAVCIWFRGRKSDSPWMGTLAATVAGLSFWIRQLSALVFPALILAEWIVGGAGLRNARAISSRRAPAILVWATIVALYFLWAKATGNYTPQFSRPLAQVFDPSAGAIILESSIYLFYLTIFFLPFLYVYRMPGRPSISASIIFCVLALTASYAWMAGVRSGPPSAPLHATFPFLQNVLTNSGVGPITLTDVYWNNVQTQPHISRFVWLVVEGLGLLASLIWTRVLDRVRAEKNELGLFGICFAAVSLIAVLLAYQDRVLDRYHYPGILGFTIAFAAFVHNGEARRLRRVAVIWVAAVAAYSTLGLHDYFRWHEARARLLFRAERKGIPSFAIDGGYEPNGWNAVELGEHTVGCGPAVRWFCRNRRYRIGLQDSPGDHVVLAEAVDAWLVHFPDLRIFERL